MVTGTFIFLMMVVMALCVILTLVILSQNPKGGGLSSTFGGGGSQMFGVQRTNDFLDKSTWTLAALIVAVVVLSNVMLPRTGSQLVPEIPAIQQEMPMTTPEAEPALPATPITPETE